MPIFELCLMSDLHYYITTEEDFPLEAICLATTLELCWGKNRHRYVISKHINIEILAHFWIVNEMGYDYSSYFTIECIFMKNSMYRGIWRIFCLRNSLQWQTQSRLQPLQSYAYLLLHMIPTKVLFSYMFSLTTKLQMETLISILSWPNTLPIIIKVVEVQLVPYYVFGPLQIHPLQMLRVFECMTPFHITIYRYKFWPMRPFHGWEFYIWFSVT